MSLIAFVSVSMPRSISVLTSMRSAIVVIRLKAGVWVNRAGILSNNYEKVSLSQKRDFAACYQPCVVGRIKISFTFTRGGWVTA
jgi:hypothetical protein